MSNTNNVLRPPHAHFANAPFCLNALAEAKKLPVAFLRQLGLEDLPRAQGVAIPYYDDTARQIAIKQRTALAAKAGSRWPAGMPVAAYGDWRIHDARKAGWLVLVEGESDCWTLWQHNVPALGLPGCSTAKILSGEHLVGIARLYVHVERDRGGETFHDGVMRRLGELRFEGQTFVLHMPDGVKDPSELHMAEPREFQKRFDTALSVARPIAAAHVHPNVPAKEEAAERRVEPVIVNLQTVKAVPVRWLWPGRIPLGKLTILDGDPGLGKSALTLDVAARLSAGVPMPLEPAEATCVPGRVLLLTTTEDALEDTIRPRLEAAGACMERIDAFKAVGVESRSFPVTLPRDTGILGELVRAKEARLVIIDPLMAYLDENVQSHNDQSVRRALAPLAELAQTTGAAILVVRHLNKQTGASALYRGGGSIGIIGAARSGLMVVKDPQAPHQRILGASKFNLGKPAPAIRYELVDAGLAPRVLWVGESQDDIDDLMRNQAVEEPASTRAQALAFLRMRLTLQSYPATEVQEEAAKLGISLRTLNRAKKELGVESRFVTGADGVGHWEWTLPHSSEPAA